MDAHNTNTDDTTVIHHVADNDTNSSKSTDSNAENEEDITQSAELQTEFDDQQVNKSIESFSWDYTVPAFNKAFLKVDQLNKKKQKALLLKSYGPSWFQELSDRQMLAADELLSSIRADIERRTVKYCFQTLLILGLSPMPTRADIKETLKICELNDLTFLWILMEICYTPTNVPNDLDRNEFTTNERLILSSICHLNMIETLKALDHALPKIQKPPPKAKPFKQKPRKKPIEVKSQSANAGHDHHRHAKKIVNKTSSTMDVDTSPYLQRQVLPKIPESRAFPPLNLIGPKFTPYLQYRDHNYVPKNATTLWFINKRVKPQDVDDSEESPETSYYEYRSLAEACQDKLVQIAEVNSRLNLILKNTQQPTDQNGASADDAGNGTGKTDADNDSGCFDFYSCLKRNEEKRLAMLREDEMKAYAEDFCRSVMNRRDSDRSNKSKQTENSGSSGSYESSRMSPLDSEEALKIIQELKTIREEATIRAPDPPTEEEKLQMFIESLKTHGVRSKADAIMLLKITLRRLAENPKYIIATLNRSDELPILVEFVLWKYGFKYTEKSMEKLLKQTKELFKTFIGMKMPIKAPDHRNVFKNQYMTYDRRTFIGKEASKAIFNYQKELKTLFINKARGFWPLMNPYVCSAGPPRSVFYTYMPDCERHLTILAPPGSKDEE